MSNIGKKIEGLINEGFSYDTLRGLSEPQINLLYSRLISEQPKGITTVSSKNPNAPKIASDLNKQGINVTMTEMDEDGMGMFEGEMTEKFESKAQQKLFWAKCNNAKTEKSKRRWCKWAKEFSKDTNFEKLPEKKKSNKVEESLTKLVEKYIPESISKKELMGLIESSTRTKEAPTKTPTKTPTKSPDRPGKRNPFKKPGALPGPKAKSRAPKWLSYSTFINAGYKLR